MFIDIFCVKSTVDCSQVLNFWKNTLDPRVNFLSGGGFASIVAIFSFEQKEIEFLGY